MAKKENWIIAWKIKLLRGEPVARVRMATMVNKVTVFPYEKTGARGV